MIVRPRPTIFQLFFIVRGSIVPRIMPQIALIMGICGLVVWLHQVAPRWTPDLASAPFALVGLALSIFLGFRNNACYDRWWEARKLWGALILAARSFARQTLTLDAADVAERERLLHLVIAFAQALTAHLRPGVDPEKTLRRLTPEDRVFVVQRDNVPNAILLLVGGELARLRHEHKIDVMLYPTLDQSVSEMAAVQAGCERIRTTPVPFGYTLLLHRTAYLFCFLLPFGFAGSLGWAAPAAVGLVAYTFFGLDALGDELEDPFSTRANALPIEALADTVEHNLLAALGETDLPPLPQPIDYVLA